MSLEQKSKQTIYNTTKDIVKEISLNYDMEFENDAMELIGELVYKKLLLYGTDIDAFQKHAKRSNITVDDVKLLVRNNKSLVDLVEAKLQLMNSLKPADDNSSAASKRKRK